MQRQLADLPSAEAKPVKRASAERPVYHVIQRVVLVLVGGRKLVGSFESR